MFGYPYCSWVLGRRGGGAGGITKGGAKAIELIDVDSVMIV